MNVQLTRRNHLSEGIRVCADACYHIFHTAVYDCLVKPPSTGNNNKLAGSDRVSPINKPPAKHL